jgi:hypothetical protein
LGSSAIELLAVPAGDASLSHPSEMEAGGGTGDSAVLDGAGLGAVRAGLAAIVESG